MSSQNDIVFLFDCDNTLLDNDLVQSDLRRYLEHELGVDARERYWQILESLRSELGYVDYLGAIQRYRLCTPNDMRLLQIASFLVDYPFEQRLYPGALQVLKHCKQWGRVAILSDGDVVFQPRKLQRSGLWDAVDGQVMIYIHKEQMLDDMMQHHPARHYVMVDDKLRILTAMKLIMQNRLTTVFPRQGHYALDAASIAGYPAADMSIEHIGDLLNVDFSNQL